MTCRKCEQNSGNTAILQTCFSGHWKRLRGDKEVMKNVITDKQNNKHKEKPGRVCFHQYVGFFFFLKKPADAHPKLEEEKKASALILRTPTLDEYNVHTRHICNSNLQLETISSFIKIE
jgi:hypothetical protein